MTFTNIKHKVTSERGFTIVELLIVIIVIGILATLVLIAYNNVQGQARDTKRQADALTLAKAAEAYKTTSTNGSYPSINNGSPTSSGTYAYDIANMPNKTVAVDQSVTDKINSNAPSSSNKDYIQPSYCPAGANSGSATGMKFVWWSETKNANGTPTVTTGAGC